MGRIIENVSTRPRFCHLKLNKTQYHRTSPFDAILAGAEDVLGDLGVRQAVKKQNFNEKL